MSHVVKQDVKVEEEKLDTEFLWKGYQAAANAALIAKKSIASSDSSTVLQCDKKRENIKEMFNQPRDVTKWPPSLKPQYCYQCTFKLKNAVCTCIDKKVKLEDMKSEESLYPFINDLDNL